MKNIRGEKNQFDSHLLKGETEIGKGITYELIARFSDINSDFGLKLRANADKSSETVIKFDFKDKKLILDRSMGEQSDKRVRKVFLGDRKELELRIFVDNSSIEIFVNNGEEVFSSRIFPKVGADKIIVFSENNINVNIEKWEWK